MNDQQRIVQLIECLDNETPISITIMREGLWAFRREVDRLKEDKRRLHSVNDSNYERASEYAHEIDRLEREVERLKSQPNPQLATGLKPIQGMQAKVFEFAVSHFAQHGYSPSVRDICEAVGLQSSSTVHGHLDRLEEKGYVKRHGKRGFTIVGAREAAPCGS